MMNHLLICGITVITIVLSLDLSHAAGSQVQRIRGIPLSKNSLYDPTRDFECLDGSRRITFDKVNDNYCDCADASDEPGTEACPDGVFYCQNAGHQPEYIPSGRVNDGVCDCCDASDEYDGKIHCTDICHELGKEARVEAEKAAELAKEGNKIRMEMTVQGQKLKAESSARLNKLKADYEEAERLKKEKELIKNEIEEKEREALDKYKQLNPEPAHDSADEKEDSQLGEAEVYFRTLDVDESGTVTMKEIQSSLTFDRDGNKIVTDEEAMYFLGHQEEVNLEEFLDKAWFNIKPFLMREQGAFKPPTNEEYEKELEQEPDDAESFDDGADDDEDHPDDEEAHEVDHEEAQGHDEAEQLPVEPEIQYDAETQALIDQANAARTQYQQVEKAVLDLQNEIRSLEGKIDRDYGPDQVFAPLDGECFQFTDLEYVYSMCMFGRATQSSKSGGSEVNLGHWHEWTGPDGNKYTKMKFDRGLGCWDGPARSVDVDLRCGKENKLVWVGEPNRCEYAMTFMTPALCNIDTETTSNHDEL